MIFNAEVAIALMDGSNMEGLLDMFVILSWFDFS